MIQDQKVLNDKVLKLELKHHNIRFVAVLMIRNLTEHHKVKKILVDFICRKEEIILELFNFFNDS